MMSTHTIIRERELHSVERQAVIDAAIRFRRAETAVWVQNEVGTTESATAAKDEQRKAYVAFVNAVDNLLSKSKNAEITEHISIKEG